MSNGPLVKAKIYSIEGERIEVTCLFNPKEYQIQRSNNWGGSDNGAKNAQDMSFTGSSGAKLSMQLFFDTYLQRSSASSEAKDVRVYTDPLWRLMNINRKELFDDKTGRGRPPRVLFSWGKTWLFNAVITSMQQQYTLFTSSGMPVRAMVTVEFQEAVVHNSVMPQSASSQISFNLRAGEQGQQGGDLRNSVGR